MLIIPVAVNCLVCIEPTKQGRVLCLHCSPIAHSNANRAALTCDLRSKWLMPAQFVECGSNPAEFFYAPAESPSREREHLSRTKPTSAFSDDLAAVAPSASASCV